MALNKRKVLDAARKHAQKGAKQKALKEYDKLLAADPRDAKLMLEVGDAYRRWGQVEEAIAQYNKVASQFRQDGFDARAVAVYKQILNLDPKRYETHVSLGDLYQHMGLDAEAIGALQTAADGYHKEGNKPKALELLRKMAALDPSNTTSRMKVADLLKQEGMESDAVAEYGEVADELKRQGALDSVPPVLERILEIEPESTDTLSKLADVNIELGRADRAEPFAARLADLDADAENLERLCTIYRSLDDDEKLAITTRSLAKLYRDRGDEDQAREIMQRLPTDAVVDAGGIGSDQSEMEEPSLSDDELLDDDEFLLGDEVDDSPPAPEPEPEIELDTPQDPTPLEVPDADPDADSAPEIEVPEGDPDQLFAEASVYLRYGKVEQAMASLKAILLQDPGHRGALEKLGEAVAEQGNEAGAVAHWTRAAELAAEQGDAGALDLLRDRIHTLDPDAAAALPSLDAGPSAAADGAADDELELELDLDVEVDAPEPSAGAGAEIDLDLDDEDGLELSLDDATGDGDVAADDGSFEIDIDADDDLAAALAEASDGVGADASAADDELDLDAGDAGFDLSDSGAESDSDFDLTDSGADSDSSFDLSDSGADVGFDLSETDPDAGLDISVDAGLEIGAGADEPDDEIGFEIGDGDAGLELSDDVGAELDIDVDVDTDGTAIEAPGDMDTSAGEHSTTTAQRIAGELEEAEFYLQQELYDEAEEIYRRVLASAPGHPSALLRLGEIEASRGGSPESVDAATDGEDGALIEEAALDIGLEAAPDPTPAADESEPTTESVEAGLDLDVTFDADTEESTEVEMLDAAAAAAVEVPASPLLAEDMADAALADATPTIEETQPIEPTLESASTPPEPVAAAADDAGDSFDLAAELAGAFEEANADDPPSDGESGETASVLSKVEDGFESIFSDFKKGVSASLEEGDYETRYDLGIAYREMGLYEDAIAEFRVCIDSTNRRLESLHMMGLCALDLGRASDAVNHLEQALATPELEEGRKVGVYFDLGRAHEAAGDPGRAESVYLEVQSLDASFPTIEERLEAVRGGGSGAPVELASEADAGFESFDDLFSEDGGDDAAPEAPAESFESFDDVITAVEEEPEPDVVDAEPMPEADDEPPTDPGSSGRRKKKISFV